MGNGHKKLQGPGILVLSKLGVGINRVKILVLCHASALCASSENNNLPVKEY